MTSLEPVGPAELAAPQPLTEEEVWERWLGAYLPLTQQAYKRDFRQWLAWMAERNRPILTATVGDVTGYIGHMRRLGLASSSMARKVSCIGSFFTWAREEGLTQANPMPSSKRRPKADQSAGPTLGLDLDTAHRVLAEAAHFGKRAHALLTVLLYTGCRVSEAIGLDLASMEAERGHRVFRVVGKGNKTRTVPIAPPVIVALDEYLGSRAEGPIFVTRTGGRLDRRDAHRIVAAVGKHAGVKLYPHLFRHTAATLALDAGAPVDRVQKWLGHASLDTTMGYVRARDQLALSPAHDLAKYLAEGA